ncbi:glutathione S-transferase [Oceanimonas baumannii]|uniref:glutathione transferase n=1 Tax=Oceanimonas baumannii TaxID=129578 RepID=A0A235CHQ8_9GAMM|nr:glutathione S-transferase [Oceanimonas baumannii]OYD23385.1 glutathione S-transferase [Oceanimonas baumannii]TDW58463.1 glutathione S-transferase [Oceanimonas baumannii]
MISLHYLNDSRAQRILWLLEELGLEYQLVRYRRDAGSGLAPADLKKAHVLGKSPVITDGHLTLAESGAIIDYLAQRYGAGALLPVHGSDAWWDYVYWLHYAEGSLMPPLLMRIVFERVKQASMPFLIRPLVSRIVAGVNDAFLDKQIHTHLNFVADHLACHKWMLGEQFSAADIQMSFPLETVMSDSALADSYPRLKSYVAAFRERPAYHKALKAGGEYRFGPAN